MQRKDKGIVGHNELGIAARVGGGDKDPVPHLEAAHMAAQLLHDTSSICNTGTTLVSRLLMLEFHFLTSEKRRNGVSGDLHFI